MNHSIAIPESELIERFVRATGPGGQHVNRSESAVELRFDAAHSPTLPDAWRERLLLQRDRRINNAGVVVIQAHRFRDQARNRQDARDRLLELLRDVTKVAKKRVPTRPSRASRERRLDAKQHRQRIKRTRSCDWSGE